MVCWRLSSVGDGCLLNFGRLFRFGSHLQFQIVYCWILSFGGDCLLMEIYFVEIVFSWRLDSVKDCLLLNFTSILELIRLSFVIEYLFIVIFFLFEIVFFLMFICLTQIPTGVGISGKKRGPKIASF